MINTGKVMALMKGLNVLEPRRSYCCYNGFLHRHKRDKNCDKRRSSYPHLFLGVCLALILLFAGIDVASATVTSGWESEEVVVAGTSGVRFSISCAAFNLTGDEQWTLISGNYGGLMYAHYWNGTQWVYDASRVAGLPDFGPSGTYAAPAIAFNLTGDGTWTLTVKGSGGNFYGYYWDGEQWIEDTSRVNGLAAVSSKSSLTMVNNLTGDGNWTLITGTTSVWQGYYWNGTQWLENASIIAGLPTPTSPPRPSVGFNLTGDGNWTLIYTRYHGSFYGYYWNGTQWIYDISRDIGLPSTSAYNYAPTLIENLRGDGKWVLISGHSNLDYLGYMYDMIVVEDIQAAENVTSYDPKATTVHITGEHSRTWDHRVKYSINPDLSDASWSQWFNDVGTFDTKVHYLQPDTTYYYHVYTYVPWDYSYYVNTPTQSFTTIPAQTPIQVNPGESIQDALDTLPLEGGTVELLSGEWNITETIRIDRSNITLKGAGKEQTHINMLTENAQIVNCNHVTGEDIFNITVKDLHLHGEKGAGHVGKALLLSQVFNSNISNVWLENNGYDGIRLGTSNNNTISDCKCNDNYHGISLSSSDYNIIVNNTCFDNGYTNIQLNAGNDNNEIRNNTLWSGGSGRGSLLIYSSSHRNLIDGNTIYQSSRQGIYIWPTCSDTIVVNNTIYGNGWYGIEVSTDCHRTLIKNNRIYNNQHGILIGGSSTCSNTTIESNTIHGNSDDGIFIITGENTAIKNNIIVNNEKYGIEDEIGNTTSSYNNVWNNTNGNYSNVSAGAGDISVDPLFADPANEDFHLKSTAGRWTESGWVYTDTEDSPCIDAGDPVDDYGSEPEPNGGRINIGAYGNTVEASKSPGAATGVISGNVTDTNGTVISNATVTDGTRFATTNETGGYVIANIPAGTYTVTASAANYTTTSVPDVTVTVGETTTVNFVLEHEKVIPPPETTYTITPPPPAEDGWNNVTPVVVTFFRSDSNSGIQYTNYSKVSATGPWTIVNLNTATGTDAANVSNIDEDTFNLTVSDEGITTIWYYSVNNNATSETVKNMTVKIHTTNGTVSGTISSASTGTGISGVTVDLTLDGTVIASTTTDSSGDYMFINVAPGEYTVTASKARFWATSTSVTVSSGETVTANQALWLKGDLNNNGAAADAGDLAMMKDASLGSFTPDWKYDLNTDGAFANAGDQAMMKDASVGNIELL